MFVALEREIINTLQSMYKSQVKVFNLTMSLLYLVKLKIAQKQQIAYCSTLNYVLLNRPLQTFAESRSMFLYFPVR